MIPENTDMLLVRTRDWQDEVVNRSRAQRKARATRRGGMLRRLARTYGRMVSALP